MGNALPIVGIGMAAIASILIPPEALAQSQLEISHETRLIAFEDAQFKHTFAFEEALGVGLAWTPILWISVRGRLDVAWFRLAEGVLTYRDHQKTHHTKDLGEFGLFASLDFHPGTPKIGLTAEIGVRSAIAPARSGLFSFSVGTGIHALIAIEKCEMAFRFGVMVRFVGADDFKKVFDLDRPFPEFALQFAWRY